MVIRRRSLAHVNAGRGSNCRVFGRGQRRCNTCTHLHVRHISQSARWLINVDPPCPNSADKFCTSVADVIQSGAAWGAFRLQMPHMTSVKTRVAGRLKTFTHLNWHDLHAQQLPIFHLTFSNASWQADRSLGLSSAGLRLWQIPTAFN